MKIEELAQLMGKTREELEEMLDKQEVIELNLNERNSRRIEDDDLKIKNFHRLSERAYERQ